MTDVAIDNTLHRVMLVDVLNTTSCDSYDCYNADAQYIAFPTSTDGWQLLDDVALDHLRNAVRYANGKTKMQRGNNWTHLQVIEDVTCTIERVISEYNAYIDVHRACEEKKKIAYAQRELRNRERAAQKRRNSELAKLAELQKKYANEQIASHDD